MKVLSFLGLAILLVGVISCSHEVTCEDLPIEEASMNEDSIRYDSSYAMKLGADEFGMRAYVMAFLKAGPNRELSGEDAAKLQRAHLDNILRMAEEGKLLIAGPFMDEGETRGIYIFNVSSVEEAKKLTETDPAIKAGSLVMELHPWYGPAGLQELKSIQQRLTKTKI